MRPDAERGALGRRPVHSITARNGSRHSTAVRDGIARYWRDLDRKYGAPTTEERLAELEASNENLRAVLRDVVAWIDDRDAA